MKDFYKILNVLPSATEEEIKVAFRKLAHQHHPDKGGSENKFKEINEAYQVLSDKYQRGAYDATIFIMRQGVTYSPIAQEGVVRDSEVIRNAIILFLIGIGLWIWGDGSDSYNGFLVFLGWVSVIGAVVVYRRGKVQNHPEKEAESQVIFRREKQEENVKEIPLENLGFSGFILEYAWNTILTERNKIILSALPKNLWDKSGVSFDDVLKHADILCSERAILTIERQKKEDEWLVKHGLEIVLAIQKETRDGELKKDLELYKKCKDIIEAEMQILGLYMLTVLPIDDKKRFLEKAYRGKSSERALLMWAQATCLVVAEKNNLMKIEKADYTDHSIKLVNAMGLIETVSFIRTLPNWLNFEDMVKKSSSILLKDAE